MKKNVIYLYILLLIASAGCEGDAVNVKTPEFGQKLVVTGFISPSDKISYISVSSNWPVYGVVNPDQPVGHLTGTISDGENEILLETFSEGLKLDQNRFKIEYGKTYTLKVRSDLGLTADSKCNVPANKDFKIGADTAWLRSQYGWPAYKTLQLKIGVKDKVDEENFYRIVIKGRAFARLPGGDSIIHHINHNERVRSDKGLDGQELQWQVDTGFRSIAELISAEITIYLYHTEESYYTYHQSLERYHGEGNPFAESTPVYSNINGGLGVFTSYTIDSVVYRIR